MPAVELGQRGRPALERRLAGQLRQRRRQRDGRGPSGSCGCGAGERDRHDRGGRADGYAGLIVIVTVVRSLQSWFNFT